MLLLAGCGQLLAGPSEGSTAAGMNHTARLIDNIDDNQGDVQSISQRGDTLVVNYSLEDPTNRTAVINSIENYTQDFIVITAEIYVNETSLQWDINRVRYHITYPNGTAVLRYHAHDSWGAGAALDNPFGYEFFQRAPIYTTISYDRETNRWGQEDIYMDQFRSRLNQQWRVDNYSVQRYGREIEVQFQTASRTEAAVNEDLFGLYQQWAPLVQQYNSRLADSNAPVAQEPTRLYVEVRRPDTGVYKFAYIDAAVVVAQEQGTINESQTRQLVTNATIRDLGNLRDQR